MPPPMRIIPSPLSGRENPLPKGPNKSTASPICRSESQAVPFPRTSKTMRRAPILRSISQMEIGLRNGCSPQRMWRNWPGTADSASSGAKSRISKAALLRRRIEAIRPSICKYPIYFIILFSENCSEGAQARSISSISSNVHLLERQRVSAKAVSREVKVGI